MRTTLDSAKILITASTGILLISGCGALKPPPEGKLFERGGVSMVVIPGGSRETYFSDPSSLERHCRAPSPDVSLTASEGVALNVPSPTGKGVGLNEDASTGALGLGGRSPAVLISRELLYRACELSNNLNLPPDQALKLFRDAMDVIIKLSTSQTAGGTAALTTTAADTRVQAPQPSVSGAGTATTSSSTVPAASGTGTTTSSGTTSGSTTPASNW